MVVNPAETRKNTTIRRPKVSRDGGDGKSVDPVIFAFMLGFHAEAAPPERVSAEEVFYAGGTIRQPPPKVNAGGRFSSTAVRPAPPGLNFLKTADKRRRQRRVFFRDGPPSTNGTRPLDLSQIAACTLHRIRSLSSRCTGFSTQAPQDPLHTATTMPWRCPCPPTVFFPG